MKNKIIFISYRRKDSQAATLGLAEQLRGIFGFNHVFLDNTIDPGNKWPDRIEQALESADILLAVIGPRWLTASDKYGRRRIDIESDWVRREIKTAIKMRIPIIPILVRGANLPEDSEALPDPLRPLLDYKWFILSDESWDRKLRELIQRLEREHDFVSNETIIEFPEPRVDVAQLSLEEIDMHLRTMKGWELVESHIPGDYPNSRLELRKVFKFRDFREAMEFMNNAVDFIERPNPYAHHPRWENIWRTVTVWLSSWDIKHRVSRLDIKLAKELDRIYAYFSTSVPQSPQYSFSSGFRDSSDFGNSWNSSLTSSEISNSSQSRLPESPKGSLLRNSKINLNAQNLDSKLISKLNLLEEQNAELQKKLDNKITGIEVKGTDTSSSGDIEIVQGNYREHIGGDYYEHY